jgi:hypothetical protein
VFHGVPRRRMSEQTHHGQPRFERISPILIIPRMAATEPNADISGKQKREATLAPPLSALPGATASQHSGRSSASD